MYEIEKQNIQKFITNIILNKNRNEYPIMSVSGYRQTGKKTLINDIFKDNKIRLNELSYLQTNIKNYLNHLLSEKKGGINIMSMFEKNPKPVVLCIPYFDRLIQYEKSIYKTILKYLENIQPSACIPIIFIIQEPFSFQKHEDIMNYVSLHIKLNGITREFIQSKGYSDFENIYKYCKGSFRRFHRIERERAREKNYSINEYNTPNFIEDEDRITMQQRMRLFFHLITENNSIIPVEIQQWLYSLQETEITTMVQTIHENILTHTNQTIENYERFLKTFIAGNQLQVFQQMYNRHTIEPYWTYSSLILPFKTSTPIEKVPTNIQFTRMLTRSSIYSNFRKFIQTIEKNTQKPLQYYINEYYRNYTTLKSNSKKRDFHNYLIQIFTSQGLTISETRRIIRTIERIQRGSVS